MDRVELARDRVREDHHAALAHERDALVEVEEVAEPHAHDEDRVQDRVDVVRADVGQPGGDDVGLAADADRLLGGAALERDLVDRADRAGGHAGHRVGRAALVEGGAAQLRRHPVGRALERGERRLLARRPARLGLGQERERPVVHVVVERRLDVEDRDRGLDDLALAVRRVVQLGLRRVHERAAVLQRVDVVVRLDAVVRAEADRDRLVAAVHRDDVDVHVDQQVGLGGALGELDGLAVAGLAEVDDLGRVLGVVVVEPVGIELVEDARADRALELGRRHPAVQRERGDQVDVVDAGAVGALEHVLDHAAADVGQLHRRQRQADVVEGDRQLHARAQQRVQRVHAERRVERGGDRGVDVDQALQRRRRVDDPAADRQPLEPERLAGVKQRRRRVLVDLDDARLALGGRLAALGALDHAGRGDAHAATSKTVLTRPARAALGACSSAFLKLRSGQPRSIRRPGLSVRANSSAAGKSFS